MLSGELKVAALSDEQALLFWRSWRKKLRQKQQKQHKIRGSV
jgi:hypothetical protein